MSGSVFFRLITLAWICVSLFRPTIVCAQTIRPGLATSAGQGPRAVTIGDFNHDGNVDIAIANSFHDGSGSPANAVTILLGNGDGTFQPPITSSIPVALLVFNILAGDFNNDKNLDVAIPTITGEEGATAVLLGNGDGTFSPAPGIPMMARPTSAEVHDLNGDGQPDLLFASTFGGDSWVAFGDGNGNFSHDLFLFTAGFATVATAADFNGDGKLDIVTFTSNPLGINVSLGNGDGTFQPPVFYSAANATDVITGDFNGDGKVDLAFINDSPPVSVFVMLGNGDGTFQSAIQTTVSEGVAAIKAADVNHDGTLDLVAITGARTITVLLGNGDGTFTQQAMTYHSGTSPDPTDIAIADFNQDGNPDVVAADQNANDVNVLLGNGDGTFIVDFGQVAVGLASTAQLVNLTNTTASNLSATGVSAAPPQFTESDNCSGALFPLDSCTFTLVFTPTTTGPISGTLTVTDSSNATHVVPLHGTGVLATVNLPPSFPFGNQQFGTTSAPQAITLSNLAQVPLSISSIVMSGDFAETDTCIPPGTVAPGASCVINATFTPSAVGPRSGTITVTDNAPGSPQVVNLSGTGVGPVVTLGSPVLSFGNLVVGSSATQAVTLANSGTGVLSISNITASGSFSQTNNCGATLAVQAVCTVTVTFTPSTMGPQSGNITVTDNAPASPQSLGLSGTGVDFTGGVSTGSSSTATVTAGQPATYTLTFAGLSAGSGTLSLTCTGAPPASTCMVPRTVTLAAGPSTNVTVTVTTTPRSRSASFRTGRSAFLASTLLVAALFGMRRRQRSGAWMYLMLIIILATLVGCGGGSSTNSVNSMSSGTPAGTYTLTVTAASGAISHSTALTLVVQ